MRTLGLLVVLFLLSVSAPAVVCAADLTKASEPAKELAGMAADLKVAREFGAKKAAKVTELETAAIANTNAAVAQKAADDEIVLQAKAERAAWQKYKEEHPADFPTK